MSPKLAMLLTATCMLPALGLHIWYFPALAASESLTSADGSFDEQSWLKDADPPTPERAAAFLDCEGLGQDHGFWPVFRQALLTEGVFGETTLQLAVRKWTDYENFQEDLFRRRDSGGEMIMTVPGLTFANGSAVETRIADLIDLPLVLQKAHFSQLFDDPPNWGPEEFAGFLACPVGFVLVQYVIFLANKVRAQLDPETLKEYWEAMLNAFGSIYSVPNYVLDHSESANWGLTSTDIAVNINTEPGVYYPRYEDYCSRHPVPPPRLTAWHEDSTSLMTLEASGPDFSGLCAGRSRIPIALIGEHGPVNLDHLSTARAALKEPVFTLRFRFTGLRQTTGEQLLAGVPEAEFVGISNFSATGGGPNDPSSPNKRQCTGGETLTLQMLRDTLRSELSRERAELRKEINGALKGVTARMDAIEKGLEHHGSRTLQAVETLSTAQAEHGVKLQAVAADTATLGQRIAALEKKVRDIQSVGSTPAANDSGRTPALIMGGWPPDTLAADVLDKANAMARYFKLEINMKDAFVPGVRRDLPLFP
eukprot:s2603_g2.t1